MAGTTVYNINKPTVAGDSGVWGGFLNTGMDTIDAELARLRVPFLTPTYNVGGTTTVDCSQTTGARVHLLTVSGASTLAFSGVPSSSFDCKLTLFITNGSAFVLTFPASVTWLSGIAPTFKASGVDIVDLETKDGGTTWYAVLRVFRPGPIFQDFLKSTTSTSDASVTSYSLPANALAVNGQRVVIRGGGVASTQNASVNVKFGTTILLSVTVVAGSFFSFQVEVSRTGASAEISAGWYVSGTTATAAAGVAPAMALNAAVTIDFRGSVTAGGTLTYNATTVLYEAV